MYLSIERKADKYSIMFTRYRHIKELDMSREIQLKWIWKPEGKLLANILSNKVLLERSISLVTNTS